MFKEIFSRKTREIKHAIYEFIGKVTVTLLLSLAILMTMYHAFEWILSFLAKPIGIGAAIIVISLIARSLWKKYRNVS